MENGEITGVEDPGPVAFSLFAASDLVDVEDGLVPEAVASLTVRRFESDGHPAKRLGDLSPAQALAADVLHEGGEGGAGCVGFDVEESQGRREAVADKG